MKFNQFFLILLLGILMASIAQRDDNQDTVDSKVLMVQETVVEVPKSRCGNIKCSAKTERIILLSTYGFLLLFTIGLFRFCIMKGALLFVLFSGMILVGEVLWLFYRFIYPIFKSD